MNNDLNNITNINEYRRITVPDTSAFYINEPGVPVEFVSQELVEQYIQATGNNTPDLWGRIESGFEFETRDILVEKRRNSARIKKMVGFVAAAALITVIAVPIMMFGTNGSKSEKEMVTESATVAEKEMLREESNEHLAAEAPTNETSIEENQDSITEDAISDVEIESGTSVSNSESGSHEVNQMQGQLKEIEGIQTDERRLIITGQFDFSDPGQVVFQIKGSVETQYDEIEINIGDKIVLSNPLFINVLNVTLYEEQITLDSVKIDDNGTITGRIIDIKHLWGSGTTEK